MPIVSHNAEFDMSIFAAIRACRQAEPRSFKVAAFDVETSPLRTGWRRLDENGLPLDVAYDPETGQLEPLPAVRPRRRTRKPRTKKEGPSGRRFDLSI